MNSPPLYLKPISLREANEFIEKHHRHHKSVQGCKFTIAAFSNGRMVGVAVVGRPVARRLDDGYSFEITRLCSDGTHNVCSFLMGACARASKAMGAHRLFTYTMPTEDGSSLRASGWILQGLAGGGNWNVGTRPRKDTQVDLQVQKQRWTKVFPANEKVTLEWEL